jgi:hypothetical protein
MSALSAARLPKTAEASQPPWSQLLAGQDDAQRPLQTTDIGVSAQPSGGASLVAAGAPSVNSTPQQGASTGAPGAATISSMNDHLRSSRAKESRRSWPERLTSNKEEATRAFDARAQTKDGATADVCARGAFIFFSPTPSLGPLRHMHTHNQGGRLSLSFLLACCATHPHRGNRAPGRSAPTATATPALPRKPLRGRKRAGGLYLSFLAL